MGLLLGWGLGLFFGFRGFMESSGFSGMVGLGQAGCVVLAGGLKV